MANKPLILIVDDESDFREIFSMKLKTAGFRIETATNGKECITKAKQVKPDLILMDMNMPVMDGAAALLKIRDDSELKNTKVAFLTSLGSAHEEVQAINKKFSKDFGAQAYLKKTDNLDSLAEQIKPLVQ